MHTHDLDGLRRFVGACFVVLRGPPHLGRAWVLRAVCRGGEEAVPPLGQEGRVEAPDAA